MTDRGKQDGIRTAGVLLREGVSKGLAPTVLVMEIGSSSAKRQASDLLPYLPEFRRLFVRLPNKPSEMKLRAVSIALSDVECVTRAVIKVRGPLWTLRIRHGIDTSLDRSSKCTEERQRSSKGRRRGIGEAL